jgi:hypothetical protein
MDVTGLNESFAPLRTIRQRSTSAAHPSAANSFAFHSDAVWLASNVSLMGDDTSPEYWVLPPDTDAADDFHFAVGGAVFMTEVLGVLRADRDEGLSDDDDLEPHADLEQLANHNLPHVYRQIASSRAAHLVSFPSRALNFLRRFGGQTRVHAAFACFAVASCVLSICAGVALIWANEAEVVCAVRYGDLASCCECEDLAIAANIAALVNVSAEEVDFIPPEVADYNDRMYGYGAVGTGIICLVMFVRACRGENPYLVYFAALALLLQGSHDVIIAARELNASKTRGNASGVVRDVMVGLALVSALCAAGLLPKIVKSFGLVGVKRGGIGPGALVHKQYLLHRAASYANRFCAYTFFFAVARATISFNRFPSPPKVLFLVCGFLLALLDAATSTSLHFSVRREYRGGTHLCLTSLVVSLLGWSMLFVHFYQCYEYGIETLNSIHVALSNARSQAMNDESYDLVRNVPLYVSLPSVATVLNQNRACISEDTVFDAEMVVVVATVFAALCVVRCVNITQTYLFMFWYFGTEHVGKLFFKPRVDEAERVHLADAHDADTALHDDHTDFTPS